MTDHASKTEDHASKTKGLMWIILGCIVGALFAFGLSPLAHVIPWSWEKSLAYTLDIGLSTSQECNANPEANQLLTQLVNRIYPVKHDDSAFPLDVRIVREPVVNAYAALGGKITLNSGLLAKAESAEEVAGVLSHEIEHVRHRHIMEGFITHLFTAQGISMVFGAGGSTEQWAHYFLNMDFTRTQEAQADEGGLERLQKAHVDNQGFKHFFERMEKSESVPVFLSDHPSSESRAQMVDTFPNDKVKPIMTHDEWLVLQHACDTH